MIDPALFLTVTIFDEERNAWSRLLDDQTLKNFTNGAADFRIWMALRQCRPGVFNALLHVGDAAPAGRGRVVAINIEVG